MLDDRLFYISCSMIVAALIAVIEWDALALDRRDTAILGPLPLARGAIVRAKLRALVLFAAAFALALNLLPSLLHPSLAVAKLPVGPGAIAGVIVGHAFSTVAAGVFGFASILLIRELLRSVFSSERFGRVSVVAQAGLAMLLVTALLLLPGLSYRVAREQLIGGAMAPYVLPPFWFLGLQETIVGDAVAALPPGTLPERIARVETEALTLYRSRGPLFRHLSGRALGGLGFILLAGAALSFWNNRRLPAPPADLPIRRGRLQAVVNGIAQRLIVRGPLVQAGFFFTLQSLRRSGPHRFYLAISLAAGVAASTVSVWSATERTVFDPSWMPPSLLAVQTLLLAAICLGLGHSLRVPAEWRANWIFHLAWSWDERPLMTGARRAMFTAVVVPLLIALVPLHTLLLGGRVAVVHAAFGLALALALLQALTLGFRGIPFASRHVRTRDLKFFGPIYALIGLLSVYGFAWIESLALTTRPYLPIS